MIKELTTQWILLVVYNRRLGSLDQHDLELWAIQEVGHQSHSLD